MKTLDRTGVRGVWVLALLLVPGPGRRLVAQDLAFTGECGNSWYQTCIDGLCENGFGKEKNNWAQQACLPNHPPFPGPGSLVYIPSNVILDGSADVMGLQVMGGGSLLMSQNTILSLTALDVINAGEIIVNDTGMAGSALTRLRLGDTTQLSGSGAITLNSPDRAVLTATGIIIQNPNHTIRGMGVISAPFENAGMVDADVPESLLTITGVDVRNTGVLRASGGGILLLEWTVLDNTDGTILADSAEVRLRATSVERGTLETVGTGVVATSGGVTGTTRFSGITNEGLLHISAGVPAEIDVRPLVNNGTIVINPTRQMTAPTYLNFATIGTIRGTGRIVLNSPGLVGARIESGAGLTQEAGHVIHGEGRIPAALNNQGIVRADVNGGLLELVGPFKTNTGSMLATNGGILGLAGIIVRNDGGRIAAEDGKVQLYGGANIIGGMLETSGTGVFESHGDPPNTLTDVWNRGQVHVVGFMALSGTSIINDGTITIGDCPSYVTRYVRVNTSLTVAGSGSIILCGQEDRTSIWTSGDSIFTNGTGHTVRGYGVLAGNVINNGTVLADVPTRYCVIDPSGGSISNAGVLRVMPDCNMVINRAGSFSQTDSGAIQVDGLLQVNSAALTLAGGMLRGNGIINAAVNNANAAIQPGVSAGRLTINGPCTQGPGARLEIELGGLTPGTEHDVLAVSGNAALAGELRILPAGGFIAQPGQQFTILTAANVSGAFTSVTGPGEYSVIYSPNSVTVAVLQSPACGQLVAPDLDLDCDVDADDRAAFAACRSGPAVPAVPACRSRDFDGDGDVDQSDFGIFQRCYSGTGKPADPGCAT